jgi:hypothetical protein
MQRTTLQLLTTLLALIPLSQFQPANAANLKLSWSAPVKLASIGPSKQTPLTRDFPSVTVHDGRLYLAHLGENDSSNIWLSSASLPSGSGILSNWTDETKDIINIRSDHAPGLASFQGSLVTAARGEEIKQLGGWVSKDITQVFTSYSEPTQSTSTPVSAFTIPIASPGVETSDATAIKRFNDKLYFSWTGKSSEDIYLTSLSSLQNIEHSSSWGITNPDGSHVLNIRTQYSSDQEPMMEVFNNKLQIVYQGESNNNIYSLAVDANNNVNPEKIINLSSG